MEEDSDRTQFLLGRIQQLERERDELQKDIEQLCMQQAGPSYLGVATRMHFQRTAALEQEIETLNKKIAACARENQNLQEELSEAYRIKSQLADLHSSEVSKNMEAEKQLKFFQNCVAAAFAERDNAIMEAEKAKEKEEFVSRELDSYKKRVEELTSTSVEEKKLIAAMQIDQETKEKQMESFKKVIDKFYAIREENLKVFDDTSWEDKCERLLGDSSEIWSFCSEEETSTSKYISSLEQEVETLRKSFDNLRNNMQVGLEIENHLKRKVRTLERDKVLLQEKVEKGLSALHDYHSKHRIEVMQELDGGYSLLKATVIAVEEKFKQLELMTEQKSPKTQDIELPEDDCRDVHVNYDTALVSAAQGDNPGLEPSAILQGGDASEALAQALQEKVAALLLLSQEEERHLLERNVNVALQKKIEDLQRNLLQVTNEKVKALMELAQVKQEYQILLENVNAGVTRGQQSAGGEKKIIRDKDGKLKNLLKTSYLRHWVGNIGSATDNTDREQSFNQRMRANSVDFASMKIENAALNESLESMEHLTSSIRKLRLALLKVNESAVLVSANNGSSHAVDDIITEAKLLKTALGSSLPISWSAESDVETQVDSFEDAMNSMEDVSTCDKVDFVCAAGLEMIELLIFAAQVFKERATSGKLETPGTGYQ
ncbi:OLC1v1002894C1 [Oldenlandia corymbosa var. corymbosa]|uniref:OLC1v1002894C1 n=1 Tax=Oldenlandia corymbosa var. corymbosa TaxID=529605 RepID=A0AAV1DB79_OLDCO|nr:OLC1v1002894C1 [Oldenlandia corymbosa var. corymbosa]